MLELLANGRIIDVAVAVIALEMIALFIWSRRSARALRPLDIVGQLLAGALLLLAVRNEATGGDRYVTLLLLMASFPAHAFDLWRRIRAAKERDGSA